MRVSILAALAALLTCTGFDSAVAQQQAPAMQGPAVQQQGPTDIRIEWEVRNRFRLFRREADFLRHIDANRAGSLLAAERRLEQLDIPLGQDSRTLSGGQQAQVMLALALGTRAPVLVLDEPLASLDPLARREFLHVLVDAVRAAGATAVLSSHVITDIEQACDRIVVLGGGRKILDESIAEAVRAHRVVDGDPAPSAGLQRVAAFPGPLGEPMTLWRSDGERPDPPGFRPATLEELVLGRLASSRRQWTAEGQPPAESPRPS